MSAYLINFVILSAVLLPDSAHGAGSLTTKQSSRKKCVQTEHTTTLELRTCLLATYDRMAPPFVLPSNQQKPAHNTISSHNNNSDSLDSYGTTHTYLPIDVKLSIFPTNLMEVDDKQQQITTHFFVTLQWRDRRLSWRRRLENKAYCRDSSENTVHTGQKNTSLDYVDMYHDMLDSGGSPSCSRPPTPAVLHFNQSQTWLPSLVVFERLNDGIGGSFFFNRLVKDAYFLQEITIAVDPKGRVTLRGYFVERCGCRMMTRLFPFDYQTCNLSVMVRAPAVIKYVNVYETRTANIGADNAITQSASQSDTFLDSQLSKGYDMGEWRLDIRAARQVPHTWHIDASEWEASLWIYQLGLVRNPMQHLLTWVIPPVITSVGAVLGLYLGCNPSERYKFGSSIVITLILMMTNINDRVAVSDDGYPVLGVLYFGLCVIVTVAAFLSTIPTKLRQHFRHELNLKSSKAEQKADEEDKKYSIEPSSNKQMISNHEGGSDGLNRMEMEDKDMPRRKPQSGSHWITQRGKKVAKTGLNYANNSNGKAQPGEQKLTDEGSDKTAQQRFHIVNNRTAVADIEMHPLVMKRTTTQMTQLANNSTTSNTAIPLIRLESKDFDLDKVQKNNEQDLESVELSRSVSQQQDSLAETNATYSSIVVDPYYYLSRTCHATFDNYGHAFADKGHHETQSVSPPNSANKSNTTKKARRGHKRPTATKSSGSQPDIWQAQTSFTVADAITSFGANDKYEIIGDNVYQALKGSSAETSQEQNGELFMDHDSASKTIKLPNGAAMPHLEFNDENLITDLRKPAQQHSLANGGGSGRKTSKFEHSSAQTSDNLHSDMNAIDDNVSALTISAPNQRHTDLQRSATTRSKTSSVLMRNSFMRTFFTFLLKHRRFDMLLMTLSLASQFVLIAYAVKEWSEAVRQNSLILRWNSH